MRQIEPSPAALRPATKAFSRRSTPRSAPGRRPRAAAPAAYALSSTVSLGIFGSSGLRASRASRTAGCAIAASAERAPPRPARELRGAELGHDDVDLMARRRDAGAERELRDDSRDAPLRPSSPWTGRQISDRPPSENAAPVTKSSWPPIPECSRSPMRSATTWPDQIHRKCAVDRDHAPVARDQRRARSPGRPAGSARLRCHRASRRERACPARRWRSKGRRAGPCGC